jgi:hypothetical protein
MWASTQLRNCECSHLLTSFSSCNLFRVTGRGLREQGYRKGLQEEGLQEAKGVAGRGCRKGLQEEGCRSRVAGRGYRKRVAGAGLQEGVAGRGVTGSKKGCRKGLRERRHSRNPLTQPLFGGVRFLLCELQRFDSFAALCSSLLENESHECPRIRSLSSRFVAVLELLVLCDK